MIFTEQEYVVVHINKMAHSQDRLQSNSSKNQISHLKRRLMTSSFPFPSEHTAKNHFVTSLTCSGSVFTKILGIFLRITLKSKKNSMLRIFLFLE